MQVSINFNTIATKQNRIYGTYKDIHNDHTILLFALLVGTELLLPWPPWLKALTGQRSFSNAHALSPGPSRHDAAPPVLHLNKWSLPPASPWIPYLPCSAFHSGKNKFHTWIKVWQHAYGVLLAHSLKIIDLKVWYLCPIYEAFLPSWPGLDLMWLSEEFFCQS